MKQVFMGIVTGALLIMVVWMVRPELVRAQSYGGYGVGPIAPTVAGCPAGISGQAIYCPVGGTAGYTTYVSYNALPYVLLVQPAAAGVTSFGNPPRTGVIVLTKADITQTGIAASVPASVAPLQ